MLFNRVDSDTELLKRYITYEINIWMWRNARVAEFQGACVQREEWWEGASENFCLQMSTIILQLQ